MPGSHAGAGIQQRGLQCCAEAGLAVPSLGRDAGKGGQRRGKGARAAINSFNEEP